MQTCSVHDTVFGHVSHAIDDVASEPTAGPSAHSHDLAQSGLVAEGVVCACGGRGAMVTLSLGADTKSSMHRRHAIGRLHNSVGQTHSQRAQIQTP
jgi:hypothetical protein